MSNDELLRESTMERKTAELTRELRINCWVVIFTSLAGTILFVVVLALSTKIDAERRIFMGTILGVTQACCVLMLVVARNDPRTLTTYITICAFVSGMCIGPSIWYI